MNLATSVDRRTGAGRARAFPRRLRWSALWPGLLAVLGALAMIPFADTTYRPIYSFLQHLPLHMLYQSATQFPSPPVVVMILASIWLLRPRLRPRLAYFLVAILLSSSMNSGIKFLTSRARPKYSIRMDHEAKAWIEATRETHPGLKITTRHQDQWLGVMPRGLHFKDGLSSFPSGHATNSFVLAAFLSSLFPEGRLLWYLAAGSTAAARVAKGRHWPEDVLFGGGIGWMLAQMVFSWRWPGLLGLWLRRRRRRRCRRGPGVRTELPVSEW